LVVKLAAEALHCFSSWKKRRKENNYSCTPRGQREFGEESFLAGIASNLMK